MNGVLLVDKPLGWSSFDVIRRLRSVTGVKKVGHAGTLDPLANGLLIILFGSACKQADQFLKLDKTYEAQVTLGATSVTDDAEGPIKNVSNSEPSMSVLQQVVQKFVGKQLQIPPQRSAIKVGGQRAYKLSRAGKKVELKAREVTIYKLNISAYKYPKVALECSVSSGTYIRSLARDIGDNLGTGGYLNSLKRTTVGNYKLTKCIQLVGVDMDLIKKNIIAVQ